MRQPLGGAVFGDHRCGDEPRGLLDVHSIDHGGDDVDLADQGVGPAAPPDEGQHAAGRQPPGGVAEDSRIASM